MLTSHVSIRNSLPKRRVLHLIPQLQVWLIVKHLSAIRAGSQKLPTLKWSREHPEISRVYNRLRWPASKRKSNVKCSNKSISASRWQIRLSGPRRTTDGGWLAENSRRLSQKPCSLKSVMFYCLVSASPGPPQTQSVDLDKPFSWWMLFSFSFVAICFWFFFFLSFETECLSDSL